MSLLEAQAKYGEINNGAWGEESKHCTLWAMPEDLRAALVGWVNSATGRPVIHIYLNKDMAPALEKALRYSVARGLGHLLKTFDGCFMKRDVRGQPGTPSSHSWAGALDINAATNQLGTEGDISEELGACFEDAGFIWGKRFHRCDPMHFSWLGW